MVLGPSEQILRLALGPRRLEEGPPDAGPDVVGGEERDPAGGVGIEVGRPPSQLPQVDERCRDLEVATDLVARMSLVQHVRDPRGARLGAASGEREEPGTGHRVAW